MNCKKISSLVLFLAIVLLPFIGFSQINPPEPQRMDAGPGGPPPPVGLPIDDHLPVLLLAGFSLGIYIVVFRKATKKVL